MLAEVVAVLALLLAFFRDALGSKHTVAGMPEGAHLGAGMAGGCVAAERRTGALGLAASVMYGFLPGPQRMRIRQVVDVRWSGARTARGGRVGRPGWRPECVGWQYCDQGSNLS